MNVVDDKTTKESASPPQHLNNPVLFGDTGLSGDKLYKSNFWNAIMMLHLP